MQLIDILIIAIALSAGFFGASYNGAKIIKKFNTISLVSPIVFAAVSITLLTIGYFTGWLLKGYFINYEHQLAFFVIAALGIKTFLEGTGKRKSHTVYLLDDKKVVFGASVVYSINYLIAGLCLFLYKGELYFTLIIFVSTAVAASYIGLLLGRTMKFHITDFTLITSGIMLIAIASKILMTHTGYI